MRLKDRSKAMRLTKMYAVLCSGIVLAAASGCGGGGDTVKADSKVVYINSSGGDLDVQFRKVYWDPFTKETGIKVINSAPVDNAKLVMMVKSGNVEWDITELSGGGEMPRDSAGGYLEKIDKSQLPLADWFPAAVTDYGVWGAAYSTVLTWDLKKWPMSGKHPTGIMDLWNQKDFPGPRSIQKGALDNIEFGVLHAGVPRDKVYPVDLDLAFKELDKLKPNVSVYWTSGAQSVQAITDGEAVMGTTWNGRPYEANNEGANLGIAWDDANLKMSWYGIPKGAKNYDNAMKLMAYMMDATRQAQAAEGSGYAGGNLKVGDLVSEALKPYFATLPEHLKVTLVSDENWWKDNGPNAEQQFISWVTR